MELYWFVFISFALSIMTGYIVIPNIVVISKRKKLFDLIDDRKSHTSHTVPRLGGVSFLPCAMFAFALSLGLRYYYGYPIGASFEIRAFFDAILILSGIAVVNFIGLADDLVGISYRLKFVVQAIACTFILMGGLTVTNLGGLFGLYEIPYFVGIIITVLAALLIINAYNLIDGVDGLCATLSIISLGFFGIWFLYYDMFIYSMIIFSFVGVLIAFLSYNYSRRIKIFMGDSGSLTLGFLIAYVALKVFDWSEFGEVYRMHNMQVIILSVIFVPIFDAVRVFAVRLAHGKSPFFPDRTHIHHKLLGCGLPHARVMMVLALMQIFLITINIMLRDININILLAIDILFMLSMNHLFNKVQSRRVKKHNK